MKESKQQSRRTHLNGRSSSLAVIPSPRANFRIVDSFTSLAPRSMCPTAEIQDALGKDAARVLPPLLSLRSVTVRLPEYILRALETAASRDGATLDAFLHSELLDFAGTWADEMEPILPGFWAAYFYPGRE